MKFKHILILFLALPVFSHAQERPVYRIPDIPGYLTLKCDFHMHTVFSDGTVWPGVRVDEAWKHGLDAIAITDHLEYRPHREDVKGDFNRSWQLAREYARGKDVIVIPGTEITKGMPPGHFNALFIKDANVVLNDDFKLSIEEAARQGAFVMWNHPGWKAQQPDTMKWWTEHSFLLKQGWLHGIEVVNYGEYYPEALNWALDSSLAVLGNSDMHGPFPGKRLTEDRDYNLTLVFATERSEGGIRDALFNGRTLAMCNEQLMGKEEYLRAVLFEALKLRVFGDNSYLFSNNTDLYFDLLLSDRIFNDWQTEIHIRPGQESVLSMPSEAKIENISVRVRNFSERGDRCIEVGLKDLLKYTE